MGSFLITLRQVVRDQLDPAIAADSTAAGRHVGFVLALLAVATAGVAFLPAWLAIGAPAKLAPVALALLPAPLLIAGIVLRTGRLEVGRYLAIGMLAVFVTVLALAFGLPVLMAVAAGLGLAATAAAAAFAACRIRRPSAVATRNRVRNAAVSAGTGKVANAEAAPVLAPDLRGAIDSLVGFSAMLAEGRLVREEDRLRVSGLIRAAGASARHGLDQLLGDAQVPDDADRGDNRPGTFAEALGEAIAATAELVAARRIRVNVAGRDELLRLPLPPGDYVPIFTGLVASAVAACRPGGKLLAALDEADGGLRLALRAGHASPEVASTEQPFLQPRAPYTGGRRETGLGLAEIGRRIAALGGELRLGRRGPGGVIVALHLPVAAAVQGGDRHHQEERHIEVRKSA